MKKEKLTGYDKKIIFRANEQIFNLLTAESLEKRCSVSEVLRQSCMEHFERNMSDAEIMHFSVAENTRKILHFEKKLDLAMLIILGLVREQLRTIPERSAVSERVSASRYEKFIQGCMESLRKNHHGVLESMILDAYEKGE